MKDKNLKLISAKFQSVHENSVLINLQVKYQAINTESLFN